MSVQDSIFPEEIKKKLNTTIFGGKFHYFEEVGSTNRIARELADDGAKEGTVVICETQSDGRGRLSRTWISPRGGLWFSFILRPQIPPKKAPIVTLLTGVAVAKAIRGFGLDAKIKWPNDVLINERKVSGILTEMDTDSDVVNYIVVGVGINANVDRTVFLEEFKDRTTSLKEELKTDISRVDLMQSFLQEMEHYYTSFKNKDFECVISEWKRLSGTLGSHVRIETPAEEIEGKAIDINPDGALILELSDGSKKTIFAGDCTHAHRN